MLSNRASADLTQATNTPWQWTHGIVYDTLSDRVRRSIRRLGCDLRRCLGSLYPRANAGGPISDFHGELSANRPSDIPRRRAGILRFRRPAFPAGLPSAGCD